MLACFFRLFILVIATVHASSIHGLDTLLIYDARITNLEDHTSFLTSLTKRGYNIVSESVATNNSIKLYEGDERLYDNLILFPLKARVISKQISVNTLLQFSSDGGDILAITSPDGLTEQVRLFLNQLDIFPSPKDYYLQDYFQSEHGNILSVNNTNVENKHVYFSQTTSKLVYRGSAALLGNSELVVPILAAPRTSFTKGKKDGEWTIGSQGYLIAAVQNKHNSRATWVGSTEFFSDQHFKYNGELIQELCKWTFREKAVIKSVGVMYSPDSDSLPYKIKDEIEYEIGFSEWDGSRWVPYVADDIQFELRMIDPYYRITMKPVHSTSDAQYYSTGRFQLPDHHGVYTFMTLYERSGISFVEEKDVKAIRHLANDEYPRSYEITNAWVNIVSIYTVIIWFVAFVFIYICSPFSSVVEKTS